MTCHWAVCCFWSCAHCVESALDPSLHHFISQQCGWLSSHWNAKFIISKWTQLIQLAWDGMRSTSSSPTMCYYLPGFTRYYPNSFDWDAKLLLFYIECKNHGYTVMLRKLFREMNGVCVCRKLAYHRLSKRWSLEFSSLGLVSAIASAGRSCLIPTAIWTLTFPPLHLVLRGAAIKRKGVQGLGKRANDPFFDNRRWDLLVALSACFMMVYCTYINYEPYGRRRLFRNTQWMLQ